MGHHEKCHRKGVALIEQEVDGALLGSRVEVAGWLVGEDELGRSDQCACDGDALTFTL